MDESAETIVDTISEAKSRANFVLVDLEGTATDRIGFAITQSDLVLIPVQGSVLDATEAAKSIKLIRQMSRVANRTIPYAVFFTRTSAAIREKTLRDIEAHLHRHSGRTSLALCDAGEGSQQEDRNCCQRAHRTGASTTDGTLQITDMGSRSGNGGSQAVYPGDKHCRLFLRPTESMAARIE